MRSRSRDKLPTLKQPRLRKSSTPLDFAPSTRLAMDKSMVKRKSRLPLVAALSLVAVTAGAAWHFGADQIFADVSEKFSLSLPMTEEAPPPPPPPITMANVAAALTGPVSQNVYPTDVSLTRGEERINGKVEYSFDNLLQSTAERVFARYKPDYGTFVALDPGTGQILAMTSFTKVDPTLGNLALRAGYPAASVFKIITAAAGIDQGKVSPGTIMPFNGKSTALYKKHVLRHKDTKWTRRPTLREAFAKSINPVFGKLGVFDVGALSLQSYAEDFGFNHAFALDVDLPTSAMSVTDGDEWSVAEAASGYTKRNTLSPLHGAMLAATIVNDGVMMEPRLVTAVRDDTGKVIYSPTWKVAGQPITSSTAIDMRELMRATVKRGSARKPFRGFFKGKRSDVEVGGKTGTLTGQNPRGRNDWFVGYAKHGERDIAFAALCVNVEKWTVKSGRVARLVIEAWLDQPEEAPGVVSAASAEPVFHN